MAAINLPSLDDRQKASKLLSGPEADQTLTIIV
jgi:hypothetical protein